MATYLITQATGQQSRWVITHLLAAGAKVHAVVRDPEKIPPILENEGVTVFHGYSDDFDSIFRAAQGCKGAFLNTFPIPGLEAQQARTVVDACKKAGVESIVVSTTLYTGEKGIETDPRTVEAMLDGYYSSKIAVEKAVRDSGLRSYTILRPALLHFDYLLPSVQGNYPELPTHGELSHAFVDGARMAHTDGHDLGRYAAAALQDPTKFNRQEIDMDFESLTIEEVRDILVKVSGREVKIRKRDPDEAIEVAKSVNGQRFHLLTNAWDTVRDSAAAEEVQKKFGIPYTKIEESLTRDKARLLECLPACTT